MWPNLLCAAIGTVLRIRSLWTDRPLWVPVCYNLLEGLSSFLQNTTNARTRSMCLPGVQLVTYMTKKRLANKDELVTELGLTEYLHLFLFFFIMPCHIKQEWWCILFFRFFLRFLLSLNFLSCEKCFWRLLWLRVAEVDKCECFHFLRGCWNLGRWRGFHLTGLLGLRGSTVDARSSWMACQWI